MTLLEHYATTDPLYKFKQAFYEGKKVESSSSGVWVPLIDPMWANTSSGYRIAPEKKTVPMTVDDLPPVCWLKRSIESFDSLVTAADAIEGRIYPIGIGWIELSSLQAKGATYSTDRKNWLPLTKEIEE